MQFHLERAALVAATLIAAGLITATASAQCERDGMRGSQSALGWPFFGDDTLTDSVLSLDGDTLAVGCVNDYTYVFSRTGTIWTEEAVLNVNGWSVAVEGDTLVIGNMDVDAVSSSAEVWTRSGTTWSFLQSLVGTSPSDLFGSAVALSGDTLVVGERNTASAHVFVRSGGTWGLQQVLTPSGPAGLFGDAVDVEGDRIVVGAPGTYAYVFERSGTTWTQTAQLTPAVPPSNFFGTAVALDGATIVVVARYINYPGIPGSAHAFVESGGVWSEQAVFAVERAISVALEGDLCIVGNVREVGGGSACFFVRSGTSWTQEKKLYGSTGAPNYGNSVALDGGTAAVLAPSWGSEDQLFFLDVDPANCPGVAFGGSPTSGVDPLTVDFTDLSTGGVTAWSWSFGDGATSDLQHPSHTYSAGTYGVSLLVEGPGGKERDFEPDYVDVQIGASATVRNGSGVNGLYLTSVNLPVMGAQWDLEIDHSHHGAALSLLRGYTGPLSGASTRFGELLVDLGSVPLFNSGQITPGSPDLYSLAVPVDVSFVGAQGTFQGAIFGSFVELTNAIDAVVGF